MDCHNPDALFGSGIDEGLSLLGGKQVARYDDYKWLAESPAGNAAA